jgi:hypothetical protein
MSRLALVVTVLFLSGPARAFATSPGAASAARPQAAATTVRMMLATRLLEHASVGVQVSQRVAPRIALDLTLSRVQLGRDHPGPMVETMARGFLFPGRHGLSFALGLSGLSAREYGRLAFFQSELAYELRVPTAPSVLLGVGPEIALNQSGQATCPPGTDLCTFLWKDRYSKGDAAVRVRLAIGLAF